MEAGAGSCRNKSDNNKLLTNFAFISEFHVYSQMIQTMSDNMKGFLYAWLNTNMKVMPDYSFQSQGGRGNARQRFLCELRVPGVDYTAIGNSTNKKDAQTNAARDFVNYLVRVGRINQSDVPAFTMSQLEGAIRDIPMSGPMSMSASSSSSSLSRAMPSASQFPPPPQSQPRGYIESIFDQKKLEEAEDVDFTADIHGGWTMENAKSRLFQYLQTTKQSAKSDFKYSESGPPHNRNFTAEMAVYAAKIRKNLYARETASSKQAASKACSLSLVRQLFHLGEIEAFSGAKKRKRQEEVPPYEIRLTPQQLTDLQNLLESLGIQPVSLPQQTASSEEESPEVSLVVNYTLTDFTPQTVTRPMTIAWSPPTPNWNCWMGANIDEGPQAFMSLQDISQELKMTYDERMAHDQHLHNMMQQRARLPVAEQEAYLLDMINNNQLTLICGETGCGKTTQVPQFILDQYLRNGCGADCNILVTQPRRISAITIAERVAQERAENLGQSCGYAVRFETVYPRCYGGILYCTVGTLLRKLQAGMRGISHIVVDEIHERDINTDFLLIVLKDMLKANRDLRVVLMSATVDLQVFIKYFGDVALAEVKGRTFPVNTFFLEDTIQLVGYVPPPPMPKKKSKSRSNEDNGRGNYGEEDGLRPDLDVVVDVAYVGGRPVESGEAEELQQAATGDTPSSSAAPRPVEENCNLICDPSYGNEVRHAMSQINEREIELDLIVALLRHIRSRPEKGAVLIFLPGWNTITILSRHIKSMPDFTPQNSIILPLHSQIPREDQRRVFQEPPRGVMKIILSTNIAETSITINDVVYVIDTCKAKLKLFTARNNLTNYATVWASRTNLEQRKGRAGRVREGFAFHLCSRARFEHLEDHQTPEMLRTPLHEIALLIKLLHLGSIKNFLMKAIQAPPIDAVIDAEFTLREMKALDKNDELTPLGKILARMPIEPRIGKMVVLSCAFGVADAMCAVASFCSVGDPFVMPMDRRRLTGAQRSFAGERHSDHVAALIAYQRFVSLAFRGGRGGGGGGGWYNNPTQQGTSQGDSGDGSSFRDSSRRVPPGNVATVQSFCEDRMLSYPIMCTILEATEQLRQILIHAGFPEARVQWDGGYRYQNRGECVSMDVLTSLLVVGLYPNVCYHKDKRKLLTEESKIALVHKSSVNCANFAIKFPSPFFVFEEKLRTNMVACKQLSMVGAIQLLLFGARKVVWSRDMVVLDDWINLKMDFNEAAMLVALRPALEALLVKICIDPEHVVKPDHLDCKVMDMVASLSPIPRGTADFSGGGAFSAGSFNEYNTAPPGNEEDNTAEEVSPRDSPVAKRWCPFATPAGTYPPPSHPPGPRGFEYRPPGGFNPPYRPRGYNTGAPPQNQWRPRNQFNNPRHGGHWRRPSVPFRGFDQPGAPRFR